MENNNNKFDFLKLTLSRYDHYLSVVNIKGRFIVALFTFVIAMILYNTNKILTADCNIFWWTYLILLLIAVGLSFWGIYKVLNAVFPYLNSGNSSKDEYHSLIYFGSVSEFKEAGKFREKVFKRSEEDDIKDLSNQVYTLSKGLDNKYKAIQTSVQILYGLGVAILLIIITKVIEVII